MEAFSSERIDRLWDRCMVFVVWKASNYIETPRLSSSDCPWPSRTRCQASAPLSGNGGPLDVQGRDMHTPISSFYLQLHATYNIRDTKYRTFAFASSDSGLHNIWKVTIFRLHGDNLSSLGTPLGISKRSMSVA